MAKDLIAFGTWVRLRRQSLVLTREELAGRVGCAEVTIRKIEADERKPSPQVAELLAQHLGLPIEQRDLFVRVARGMLAVEQLPLPIPGAATPNTSVVMLPIGNQQLAIDNLPRGTVTFLFTDIEGSTRQWEQQPDAMRGAIARHDTILREVIEAHNGHVFKTVGDAFCAAFASAPDALRAAMAGQRALVSQAWGTVEPLRVRMALHTGTAEPHSGDYLGQPLNRIARLLAAGHGGQILLSLATHELVRDHLPEGASLSDLGSHRLKDLARPEPLFQMCAPDLPADFPALNSLDARSGNLPAQVNELIGRTREVAEVVELLNRARLVTLTGPGGTGKTRLALQIGVELRDRYRDGIWFVDLSPVSDPDQIATAIAQVLGIPESPDRPIRDGVVSWLREHQVLLILDNCEQVIAGAADLVANFLRSAAHLTMLATSRIPLRITAEHEYAVAPLGLPDPGALPALDQLSQYDAVALFIARARAVQADFSVTNANAPVVAEICARLDGLPLAIELAAARIRMFLPDQLLSRLVSARMRTLTGGARDLPARQQTIRATIDWSYRLLTPPQQILFARLGVFVGGWTLEAAEAIGDLRLSIADRGRQHDDAKTAPDVHARTISNPPIDITTLLEALVEQNLVRVQETDSGPRYTMLETIREYALERLAERGETELIQQRHAEYFAGFVQAIDQEPRLHHPQWMQEIMADRSNIFAAIHWLESHQGDGHAFITIVGSMVLYWAYQSLLWRADVQHWLQGAIAAFYDQPTDILIMSPALLSSSVRLGDYLSNNLPGSNLPAEGKELLTRCVTHARMGSDARALALSLIYLARAARLLQQYTEAEVLLTEAIELCQNHQLTGEAAWAYISMIDIEFDHHRLDSAAHYCLKLQDHLLSEFEDAHYVLLGFLGDIAEQRGQYDDAWKYTIACHAQAVRVNAIHGVWLTTRALGWLAWQRGLNEEARHYMIECLSLARSWSDPQKGIWGIEAAARYLQQAMHNPGAAVRLYGCASIGANGTFIELHSDECATLEAACSPDVFESAWASGRTLTWQQAADEALVWLQQVHNQTS